MHPIRNTSQLREAVSKEPCDFKLRLQGGLYSRKTICLLPNGRFGVVNHIDDSEQNLSGRQLYTHSNIGKAMKRGALVAMSEAA